MRSHYTFELDNGRHGVIFRSSHDLIGYAWEDRKFAYFAESLRPPSSLPAETSIFGSRLLRAGRLLAYTERT
jgi:hypothetical protein